MDSAQPAIELRSVGFAYRRRTIIGSDRLFWALRGASFDVPRGTAIGVIGRNGAGKSTLMRLLAGIYAPDEGVVQINVGRVSLLALQLGFHPHLDGRDNAIMSGLLLGKSKEYMLSRMAQIKSYSGLGQFFDRPLREYSTGMRARLGFSVALEADPDVLLIDEVLGVGDMEFREKSSVAIRDRVDSGQTTVLVSHSPERIRSLCRQFVWLENGGVQGIGDSEQVLADFHRHTATGGSAR